MSMQLGMALAQKMKQELRMTPQMHMSIRHLQLSRIDIEAEIQKELIDNPLLEQLDMNEGFMQREADIHQADAEASREGQGGDDARSGLDLNSNEGAERARDEMDWDRYVEDMRSGRREMDHIRVTNEDYLSPEQNYSQSSSLSDHLLDQVRLTPFSMTEKEIATEIIGNLDDRGYLRGVTAEEIALQLDTDVELVEEVIETFLTFDPIGVGARTLSECLLAQCQFYGLADEIQRLITHHLDDLERNRMPQIAKSLNISIEQVLELVKEMRRLDPSPGLQYSSETSAYIKPDVFVEWVEGQLKVRTNDEGLPRLRINLAYRDQLQQAFTQSSRSERSKRRRGDPEAQRYLSERLNSADWFIKSLQNRKRTIVRVMEEIVRIQYDFFVHGPERLKPLVLKQVAEALEMHESTISRVTSNKYVETPLGVYELKFFFSSTIQSVDGSDDLAGEAVKIKLRRMISGEDSLKPLSDQRLVELLEEDGISIARRTVAKYREQMGILSSSKRRRHV